MDPSLTSSQQRVTEKKRPRPLEAFSHAKKLRSNIPRRKRVPTLPILCSNTISGYFLTEDEAESSSSCLQSEVSNGIVTAEFMGHPKKTRSARKARLNKTIRTFQTELSLEQFRPITRLYSKRKNEARSKGFTSGVGRAVYPLTDSAPSESEGNAMTISEVSEFSATFPGRDPITGKDSSKAISKTWDLSESTCLEAAASNSNVVICLGTSTAKAREPELERKATILSEENYDLDLESDLACPEQFLEDDGSSDYSACNDKTLLELESCLFDGIYEDDSSEVSLSDLIESPDYFSERSQENSTPSVAFSLFQKLKQLFIPSSFRAETSDNFQVLVESDEFGFVKFSDKEIEESYQIFRSRERNENTLHDYTDVYYATTEFGDLVVGQRLVMVNWMQGHCEEMEHQDETLFLGVNLMDRVLSRGYFQTEKNLQLLGIACATLAARLEENQPFNSVRQKYFKVGNNVYKRSEVVSMEWHVLKVLRFHCFVPTTHNFLWFYMKAARAGAEVEGLCRYLALLALLDHKILCFWPSTVAAGLVILACLATNNDSHCDVVLETHLRSRFDDLPECIQSLEWLVKYASLHLKD